MHRWSRTPTGWAASPAAHVDSAADDGLGIDAVIPASPQQHVELEADEWGVQWGVGLGLPGVTFPPLAAAPPRMRLPELVEAILAFPMALPSALTGIIPAFCCAFPPASS